MRLRSHQAAVDCPSTRLPARLTSRPSRMAALIRPTTASLAGCKGRTILGTAENRKQFAWQHGEDPHRAGGRISSPANAPIDSASRNSPQFSRGCDSSRPAICHSAEASRSATADDLLAAAADIQRRAMVGTVLGFTRSPPGIARWSGRPTWRSGEMKKSLCTPTWLAALRDRRHG